MKMYCVFDEQFNIFSDPFLALDNNAAERIVIQSASVLPEIRARMNMTSLYLVAEFTPDSLLPVYVHDGLPLLVSCSERLVTLCEVSEHKLKKEDSFNG